ncbi:MAG: sodium:solute symporter family protein [Phycisphaerae bacterium]|nr:sodium:solute symporter family protein [Phycisphaerae bacterium]
MFGLHIADVVVLGVYFIGITLLGVWAARLVKTMGDFFMPRKFGKMMLITHAFGTGTHSDQAVGVASKTFTDGLSGIWYQWLWLFCTPFYWLIAPIMRRFRAMTTADVFVARYGRSVGMLFAFIGAFQLMFVIGMMLKGSGAVVSASLGGEVESNTIILIMTGMFVAYGVAGGLSAAIITDFVQGILTVVFSFILVPYVLDAVGGLAGLRDSIDNSEKMFSLTAPGGITAFYIAIIALNALIGIVTQPHTMGTCAAVRTESDGRVGFTVGNFVKRICTMAWCITGLAAVGYLAGGVDDPDKVYGLMAKKFFPEIMPGLLGVFIASLLASVMSSCDSFMIASSALFTENLYKPLVPDKSQKHYLLVGRITALAIVAGGLTSAYTIESVVKGLEIFWKIAAMMGIAFWLGLLWRRATVAGAWASCLSAFAMLLLSMQEFFIGFIGDHWPGLVGPNDKGVIVMVLHWQMIFYLVTGFGVGIVVSLLTKPVAEGKLERFYQLVRTPVETGEGAPDEPCTLPEGIAPKPRRVLIGVWGLEIPVPRPSAIIGFVVSWLVVGAMILGFYVLTR